MARTLLKSGIVVTQAKTLGVLPRGDVLIDGERIAALDEDFQDVALGDTVAQVRNDEFAH